jgi:hypothetical protein
VRASRHFEGLRGTRYGEVLLILDTTPVQVEIYNTFPLNDCPDALWQRLDPVMIARDHNVDRAILNGPRYWMIDAVSTVDVTDADVRDFGGLSMRHAATLSLDGPLAPHFYHERRVQRGAKFVFDAGRDIYELVAPDGRRYVLQAYCVSVDPTINDQSLVTLGERLQLPQGWTYQRRVLDEDLAIDTTLTDATVIQDELQNTYALVV